MSLSACAAPRVWSRVSTVQGPAISEKWSPPTRRPAISRTLRPPPLTCAEASLYGLRIGTTWSTPSIESGSMRATCSRSPMQPIRVTSSPWETWARAPTDSTRAMTAPISSSVAVCFITINIRVGPFGRSRRGSQSARLAEFNRQGAAGRLAKSPGVCVAEEEALGGGATHWLANLQEFPERVEEFVVLGGRAVGHSQRARLAQRAARADEHAALGEALDDVLLDLRSLGQVEPREVGLR